MYGAVEGIHGEDSALYMIPVETKKELGNKDVNPYCSVYDHAGTWQV